MLKQEKSAYGGDLLKTRAGRSRPRPIAVRDTMHLVLRSTQATGDWSFRHSRNRGRIQHIVEKAAFTYGIRIISMANVGNHLHLQIKLSTRLTYNAFIRSITGAIAMAVSGRNRWAKAGNRHALASGAPKAKLKFWDRRPFSRIVTSFRGFLKLRDYVRINQLEGDGFVREAARMMIEVERTFYTRSG
jgi:REP element-mobilizing transposase RayT